MEIELTIRFTYVETVAGQQHAAELALPVVKGVMPLKPVSDALRLKWEDQRAKVKTRVADCVPGWEVFHELVTTRGGAQKQLCVHTDTLQLFLNSINPKRSKDPEQLLHFQQNLVPTILHRLSGGDELPEPEVATSNVIYIDRELDAADKARKILAHTMCPDDVAWASGQGHVIYGMDRGEIVTMGGGRKRVEILRQFNDLHNPATVQELADFVVNHKASLINSRQLYLRGKIPLATRQVPASLEVKIDGAADVALNTTTAIPTNRLKFEKTAAKVVTAPWQR